MPCPACTQSHLAVLNSMVQAALAPIVDYPVQSYAVPAAGGTQVAKVGPACVVLTGTLNGGAVYVLDFDNKQGFWYVDISRLNSGEPSATLRLKNGTKTVDVTIATAVDDHNSLLVLRTYANGIASQSA